MSIDNKPPIVVDTEFDNRNAPWIARALAVGMLCSLLLASVLDKLSPDRTQHGPQVLILGGLSIFLGSLLVLLDSRTGIAVFILVSCISPRFGANFRLEDMLLPAIILVWVGRTASGDKFFIKAPITTAFVLSTVTMVLSFFWGMSQGTIPSALTGVFISFKRVEYGLLFVFAMNSVRTRSDGRGLLVVFLVGAILASIISVGSAGTDATVGDTRVTGLDDENYNTFAGFLVIAASLSLAGFLHFRGKLRVLFGVISLLLVFTLLKTYSREGYFILAASLATLGIMRYRVLIPLGIAFALLGQYMLPDSVLERMTNSVTQVETYQTQTAGENSFTARVSGWSGRWGMVEHEPILGSGPGSVPLHIDNEYLLRLIESGVIGLAAFLYLLAAFAKHLLVCVKRLRGTESEPFAYGLLAAFVAMLVQGFVAAAWSTIRTMEPFWILCGALGGLVIHGTYSLASPVEEPNVEAINGD
jgi:O-antigen ligase